MMSDEYLTDVLCRELEATQDIHQAVRAVRLAVEAYREEQRHKRLRPDDGGQRGSLPVRSIDAERVSQIGHLVAEDLGLGYEAVMDGTSRYALHARWVVAAIFRRYRMSLPVIARTLGMTDHTRALDGIRRLEGFPDLVACRDRVLAALAASGWGVDQVAPNGREAA
jgi:hypothetical protein